LDFGYSFVEIKRQFMQLKTRELEKLRKSIKKQLTESLESERSAEEQKRFLIKKSKQVEKFLQRKD
jgi:hypothetical protein